MERHMIHNADDLVNPTSITIMLGTFLLDAVNTNPLVSSLTVISICFGILYHVVKIVLELIKAYTDHKSRKSKANETK